MKRIIWTILIILTLSLITGLSNPKNKPKITLLSSNIAQSASSIETPQNKNVPPAEWQTVRMRVTAYCPCAKCCGPAADWTTASGHKIQPGEVFVATDKQYSFGTEMIVPGYNDDKPVQVLDRGSSIHGDRIDVFFTSHQQALNWGVKYVNIHIRTQ